MTDKSNERLTERIFLEYKPRIYGFIAQKGVPPRDRDDVFSEIMLKAVSQEKRYDSGKSSPSTWIFIISRSVVINYFNKQKPETVLDGDLPDDIDLERGLEYEEDLSELAEQLSRLHERERRVIILRIYKDMEYSKIASIMNTSEGNVRVIYSRAIKRLRERMTAADNKFRVPL